MGTEDDLPPPSNTEIKTKLTERTKVKDVGLLYKIFQCPKDPLPSSTPGCPWALSPVNLSPLPAERSSPAPESLGVK